MDKAITTALLIVVSMVMAAMLFNVAYPATIQAGDAMTSMASQSEDRMRSQIAIIHAAGELDSEGDWADTNNNGTVDALIWVKNIGQSLIAPLDRLDVFFGEEGDFHRIPYENESPTATPYWSYELENASEWTPTATLRIIVHYSALDTGRYYAKVVAPNGTADTLVFGM